MGRSKVVSLAKVKQERADRHRYTAENARGAILGVYDDLAHRAARPDRDAKAELERRNRKRW